MTIYYLQTWNGSEWVLEKYRAVHQTRDARGDVWIWVRGADGVFRLKESGLPKMGEHYIERR